MPRLQQRMIQLWFSPKTAFQCLLLSVSMEAYERCGPAKLAEMKKQTAIAKDASLILAMLEDCGFESATQVAASHK